MFTQIGMLWWLAAAAAPLLIHLLSRRRYREVSWAAMEYLLAACKSGRADCDSSIGCCSRCALV